MKNSIIKKIAIVCTIAVMAIGGSSMTAYAFGDSTYLNGYEVDQYDIKVGESYIIRYAEAGKNPASPSVTRYVTITDVYEQPGIFWGTNRVIKWIDNETSAHGCTALGTWGTTKVYNLPDYMSAESIFQ